MDKYLLHVAPQAAALRKLIGRARKRRKTHYLREQIIQNTKVEKGPPASANEFVSVLTTARHAGDFIHDFYQSFRNQKCHKFEVIFVDDGAADDTAARIESLWDIEADLNVIRTPPIGRAAALNLALSVTNSDICLIADVDDISLPGRVGTTLDFFLSNPDQACVSFNTFDERRLFFTPQHKTPPSVGIRSRSLFGMPVAFPTFAFRRSVFSLAFDEALKAGIDCDWIHRNLRTTSSADGRVMALNMVYRREHPDQITSRAPDVQRSVAVKCTFEAQTALLGPLSEKDQQASLVLGGWDDPTLSDLPYIEDYTTRMLMANLENPIYDQIELELMLFDRFAQLKYKALRQKNEMYKAHISRARAKPFGYLLSTLKKKIGR
jgi:glycosyltransferase involved in cell wall biosynthesis